MSMALTRFSFLHMMIGARHPSVLKYFGVRNTPPFETSRRTGQPQCGYLISENQRLGQPPGSGGLGKVRVTPGRLLVPEFGASGEPVFLKGFSGHLGPQFP